MQVCVVEVLLYVHRNRRLIRDRSPGRPLKTFTQLLSSGVCVTVALFLKVKQGSKKKQISKSGITRRTSCTLTVDCVDGTGMAGCGCDAGG